MRKSELKEELKEKKFYWFVNDADGLSMVDCLTVVFVLFYIICKSFELITVANGYGDKDLVEGLQICVDSIESIVKIVITYYFLKKGVDSSVAKIVLNEKYKEMYNDVTRPDIAQEKASRLESSNNNNTSASG